MNVKRLFVGGPRHGQWLNTQDYSFVQVPVEVPRIVSVHDELPISEFRTHLYARRKFKLDPTRDCIYVMVSEGAEKQMTKAELAEQVAILYGGRASTAQQMALLTIDEARRINSAEDGGTIYDRRLGLCPAGCGGERPFPETHGEDCPYVRAWEEAPTRVVLARPEAHIEWCNKNWREYWSLDTGDWAATIDGCQTPALVFEIEQMAGDVFYGKGSDGSWWTKRHLRPAWPKEINMQKLIDCPDGGAVCVSQETFDNLSGKNPKFEVGKSYRTKQGSRALRVEDHADRFRFKHVISATSGRNTYEMHCFHGPDGSYQPNDALSIVEPWPDDPPEFEITEYREPRDSDWFIDRHGRVKNCEVFVGCGARYICKPRVKCLTPECKNHKGEGTFIGDYCSPCEYAKHLRRYEDPRPKINPLKDRWVQMPNKKWYCRACGVEEGCYHEDHCHYRPHVVADGLEPKPKTETPSECAKRLKDQLYCKHCNTYLGQMHALSCPDHSYRHPFGIPIPIVAVQTCPCCLGRLNVKPSDMHGLRITCPECGGTGTQKVGPTVIARG
jgi:hypothetical protein